MVDLSFTVDEVKNIISLINVATITGKDAEVVAQLKIKLLSSLNEKESFSKKENDAKER